MPNRPQAITAWLRRGKITLLAILAVILLLAIVTMVVYGYALLGHQVGQQEKSSSGGASSTVIISPTPGLDATALNHFNKDKLLPGFDYPNGWHVYAKIDTGAQTSAVIISQNPIIEGAEQNSAAEIGFLTKDSNDSYATVLLEARQAQGDTVELTVDENCPGTLTCTTLYGHTNGREILFTLTRVIESKTRVLIIAFSNRQYADKEIINFEYAHLFGL